MSDDQQIAARRASEQLDVQLVDVLAQIEALLRHGREIQRAALLVRGVPDPVSPAQRLNAGRSVCQHIEDTRHECHELVGVLDDLAGTSAVLNQLLGDGGD